jgi:hypothetical protein
MWWGQELAEMIKFPSQSSMLIFVVWMWSVYYMASSWCFMSFLVIMSEPALGLPSGWLVACVAEAGILHTLIPYCKIGFRNQEDVYFLGVEKYFDFSYALGQPVCIPRCYFVYVNCLTLCWILWWGYSWACPFVQLCFGKTVSNLVKGSCINLINMCYCVVFVEIFYISILCLLAWAYIISVLPSDVCGAAGLSISCLGVSVKWVLGEVNLVHMISWYKLQPR